MSMRQLNELMTALTTVMLFLPFHWPSDEETRFRKCKLIADILCLFVFQLTVPGRCELYADG